MSKITNLIVVFVFMFTQVGMAHSGNVVKKTDKNWDKPLSSLLLTEKEIAKLSNEDKTYYFKALMYLVQVIEVSQSNHFEYETEISAKASSKDSGAIRKPASVLETANAYMKAMVTESQAVIGAALGWTMRALSGAGGRLATGSIRTIEASKGLTSGVSAAYKSTKAGATRAAADSYAKRLVAADKVGDAAQIAKLESSITKAGFNPSSIRTLGTQLTSKDGILAGMKTKLGEVKTIEKQLEAARSAGNAAEVRKLSSQLTKTRNLITKDERAFYAAGGRAKDMQALYRKSNTSTARVLLSNVGEVATIGYLGYEGGKAMGYWGKASGDLNDQDPNSESGVKAGAKAFAKDPGKIIRERGYSCIYGGRPARFVAAKKGVLCGFPEHGENETCKKSDGKFQCNHYGFSTASGPITKELCIDRNPIKDLTLNCMVRFEQVLNEVGELANKDGGQAVIDLNDQVKKMLAVLESDIMSDTEDKSHSFAYYCEKSKNAQKAECLALETFVNSLKQRAGLKATVDSRTLAAAAATSSPAVDANGNVTGGDQPAAPASPEEPTPAGPPAEKDLTPVGPKQTK
jgi:hypothetical protein